METLLCRLGAWVSLEDQPVTSVLSLSSSLEWRGLSTPITIPHHCACWNVGKAGLC